MKTSIKMQLKIIDKMRENLENGLEIMAGIQFKGEGKWIHKSQSSFEFDLFEYRVEPSTITINGVEIPKPLSEKEIEGDKDYFHIENDKHLCGCSSGSFIIRNGIRFVYNTEQEAIEASKLLFGIKG